LCRTPIMNSTRMVARGFAMTAAVAIGLGAARGTACPRTAILNGPPDRVRRVAVLLQGQGVSVDTVACPRRTVVATLSSLPGAHGLELRIQDQYGRASN